MPGRPPQPVVRGTAPRAGSTNRLPIRWHLRRVLTIFTFTGNSLPGRRGNQVHNKFSVAGLAAAICMSLVGVVAARADVVISDRGVFEVIVDTTSLMGHPSAPFFIEFQLNDGLGTGDTNNTALLSDFAFGGGSPVGTAMLTGGASGDLGSHVVIADDQFFNEFIQEFVPGNRLSFHVELSTAIDPGPQPDQFSFAILDCSLVEIPTLGPADALVVADIDADNPVVRSFAGDASRLTACAGEPLPLTAPRIPGAPEPGMACLIALGLATAALFRRKADLSQPG